MSDVMPALAGRHAKIALIAVLAVISLLITGFVWAQNRVSIIADGQKITVSTLSKDPYKILEKTGIILSPQDEIYLSTKTVMEGSIIEVSRAVPITLTYRGKTSDIFTGKRTLREVADAASIPKTNIRIDPGDHIRPFAGLHMSAIDLDEKITEQEAVVPFSIIRQPDANLEKGLSNIIQTGENGLKKVALKTYLEDNREVKIEVLAEEIIIPAKHQIENVGTRDIIETSRGSITFKSSRYMEATAYLPTDGDGNCITATGIRARRGIVAVDPKVIPLGSRVYIEGYGVALAADTGGAIIGDKIGLCMEDLSEALNFGRRTIKVYILS